jgi:hypothetical protein
MWSSLAPFAVFAFVGLVLPGLALHRVLRLPIDPALVLPLGTAITAGLYWLSLVAGQPLLFPLVLAAVSLGIVRGGGPRDRVGPSIRGALVPLGLVVILFAITVYRVHRVDATGRFLLDGELSSFAADAAFHVGVARELTVGYPPQVPGLAGFPLSYHLGADLVRAAALRWARVDPYDSLNRLDVTLFALALILTVRGAARLMGLSARAVMLSGFTVVLADFSFLFAGNPQAHWWADLLRGNVLVSLVHANPIVPALALALGSLIALAHHGRDGRRGWLVLALLQALAVPFFKVFLGAHLAFGLAAAAVLRRSRPAAILCGAAALSTAIVVLGAGTGGVQVSIAPLDLVNVTRETLGLPVLAGMGLVTWSLLWLFSSLGVRGLGVWPAWRGLKHGNPSVSALAALALSGWPLGLLFKVAPPDAVAHQKAINDAAFLLEQAGPLLWLFALASLDRLAERRSWGAALAALAVAVSLPSTAQFVAKKAMQAPHPIPAATLHAMRTLAEATVPGEVVLQRPSALYPAAPVVFIGRRVPYDRFISYLTQFAPRAALEERQAEVHRFFEEVTNPAEAAAIARALGTRYLCLYPHDPRVRFDVAEVYEPVFDEEGTRVYRLKDRTER